MGNCQAIDAATLVIQHPGGRVEKLYWPVTASEIMRLNPGYYVALIIAFCLPEEEDKRQDAVRITRIKVLRPTDTLVLGQAYRLITSQEVMKGLWAKKYAKMKKTQAESIERPLRMTDKQTSGSEVQGRMPDLEKTNQVSRHERHQPRTMSMPSTSSRSRPWRPSLQSISEASI
ncbi:PREDICTED: uncharacterized protein LOC104595592 [Nelumbo nucifera]|uniref:Uncharacterized protein LOC104595592 n=1 Tax=Nelumbo nucifera TaxID=4432 RepID=A0A1U7ZKV5_NELNU|nr:PREDICTED: uncharacterized protein LOC104595592 [Nelumbo nucifera]